MLQLLVEVLDGLTQLAFHLRVLVPKLGLLGAQPHSKRRDRL